MRQKSIHVAPAALAAIMWLVSSGGPAAQRSALDASLARLQADRGLYGLTDATRELAVRASRRDVRGVTHTRFDQVHRGIPVFEGEAITHASPDGTVTVTSDIRPNLNVDVRARVARQAAVSTALASIAPLGAYELRDTSLWILPGGERSVVDRLVWHVAVLVENDFEEPAAWQYFIDAHNGSVVWAYDSLETTAAVGTGRTMYVGNQPVNTDFTQGTYFLRDLTRGGGNYTCDMRNRSGGTCAVFSRTNNIFGNNSRTNSDRATAGADAHVGLQATWSYYQTMFGRNGINGAGRRTFSRVHYGSGYENAFWRNSCFCMTYGDGATTFFPLVSVDVAGHEMSHGVMSTEANLTYAGESGGLNESSSDIFGTLVEFFVNSTQDVPDYWIGERIPLELQQRRHLSAAQRVALHGQSRARRPQPGMLVEQYRVAERALFVGTEQSHVLPPRQRRHEPVQRRGRCRHRGLSRPRRRRRCWRGSRLCAGSPPG